MAKAFAWWVIIAALVAVTAGHVLFAALVDMVVWAVVDGVLNALKALDDATRRKQ